MLVMPLEQIAEAHRSLVGGKALALAILRRKGLRVPDGICLATGAYEDFVESTGLREFLLLELSRKQFDDMRWEELWDAALRIRNAFLRTAIPSELADCLLRSIRERFGQRPLVLRSSAPGEDSKRTSFAGLHESYVNVQGDQPVLEHVRLVWASLWSDRALLYRQELGLAVESSTMAVLVQPLVASEVSGVAFSQSPTDSSQAVIEAVYGLNQGLVDGSVEPDRWVLDRSTGVILDHVCPERGPVLRPGPQGAVMQRLSEPQRQEPPLRSADVAAIYGLAMKTESIFGGPQDVEWTFAGEDDLRVLQSRPITTTNEQEGQKGWYVSLRRSFGNLEGLREKIENELIPAMRREAEELASQDLEGLPDVQLASAIAHREKTHQRWRDVYWEEFIPYAHGVRLFGQLYNDALHPEDPYEFTALLSGTPMLSVQRNQQLTQLADMIRSDAHLRERLERKQPAAAGSEFEDRLGEFMDRFSDMASGGGQCLADRPLLIRLLLELAGRRSSGRAGAETDAHALREAFLSRFSGDQRDWAARVLELARSSYRLRDDDNVHLGRIESQFIKALAEGRRRLSARLGQDVKDLSAEDTVRALRDKSHVPDQPEPVGATSTPMRIRPRQLVGQPAGPGVATGRARVIENPGTLHSFQADEILVCDAVDPNMTFVVPLAAGLVERRGGMLIHGAIIAREYGLPCVTGVPDATRLLRTGDRIVVDGYLGIVTVQRHADSRA